MVFIGAGAFPVIREFDYIVNGKFWERDLYQKKRKNAHILAVVIMNFGRQ
jgi:hypothetical protein